MNEYTAAVIITAILLSPFVIMVIGFVAEDIVRAWKGR